MSDDNKWIEVLSKKGKKIRMKNAHEQIDGRNFESARPNDTKEFLQNEEPSDDDDEDDNEENIVLGSPFIWHQFGLIGDINYYIDVLLKKYSIYPCSESGKLSNLGNRIIVDNWRWNNEYDCLNDLQRIAMRCRRHFTFLSVISHFTERVYGDEYDMPIYFVHIRFDEYFLAEKKPKIAYNINIPDYYGFLGDTPTHVPISESNRIVEDNRANFMRIMRIVEGKVMHDQFQLGEDEKENNSSKKPYYTALSDADLEKNKKSIYKCKLFLEDSYSGYGVIMAEQNLERKIYLHNRRNCYQAFNHDIVNIMVFQKPNEQNSKKKNTITWSGRVVSVESSEVKPINKIFLCKLSYGQANLMIPICKTIPEIDVDNSYAQKRVAKECDNLIDGLRDVIGIENLIQRQVKLDDSQAFANKCFVTIKTLQNDLRTTFNRIQYVDCYKCDFIFLVIYRQWTSYFRFPYGEIVGLYTPDASFAKTLSLISVSCDLSVVSIDEEKELKEATTKIKVETLKNRQIALEKRLKPSRKVFSFKYKNQLFNEVAYSYQDIDMCRVKLGVHVVDVARYIKKDDFLYKYAMKQFFTYLLPYNQRPGTDAKPSYLFSEALTNEILSINKKREAAVISFYFTVNRDTLLLESSIDFEQLLLDEEFDVEIVDEMIEKMTPAYGYLGFIKAMCVRLRSERLGNHCIPANWFYPDFSLRMNASVFIIRQEMDCLANQSIVEKMSTMAGLSFPVIVDEMVLYERKLQTWIDDVKRKGLVPFSPVLNKLCHASVTQNRKRSVTFTRQFLEQTLRNDGLNLFKCDMLFPDVSYHLNKLTNIVVWHKMMLNSDAVLFPFAVSITKPLSCFSDLVLQQLLISSHDTSYTDVDIYNICESYNDNKVIYDKYWSICRGYDIRDRFGDVSFVLDCVYDDLTDNSIRFHHPFLSDVYHDNFVLLECLGLNKVTFPDDLLSQNILLEWQTRIFLYELVQGDPSLDNHANLEDIYVYITRLWRDDLNSTELQTADERHIEDLLSVATYTVCLTSEKSQFMDPKITLSLELQKRQILRIQFNYDYALGIMRVSPQLLIVNPDLRLCLCHRHDPFKYFIHPSILSQVNYSRFLNLDEYKRQFRTLNRIEGIHQTISDRTSYFIHNVTVCWIGANDDDHPAGTVHGVVLLDHSWCTERFIRMGHKNLKIQDPVDTLKKAVKHKEMEFLICIQSFLVNRGVYWLGHAQLSDVAYVGKTKEKLVHLTMNLTHSSFPMKPRPDQLYSLEIMETPITGRVLDRNLRRLEEDTFVERIVMKKIPRGFTGHIHIDYDSSIVQYMVKPYQLNAKQHKALNIAINREFSLIWGPPGTGKTMVGCLIAYAFNVVNKRLFPNVSSTILYCGPSNQSVDVVAEKLMKTFGEKCPKLLRIFSSDMMNNDFPYAGAIVNNELAKTPEFLKTIALHHIIRQAGKPYTNKLQNFESYFQANKLRNRIDRREYSKEVRKYLNTLTKAFHAEVESGGYEIVLCTTVGSCKKLLDLFTITQVIIDECGMCSEPETLGPILNRENLRNTLFIGDHMQLRPIITSQAAKGKQLNKSLFERLYDPHKEYCTMLDTQYRMHPSICEFPSKYFYGGELRTARSESWTGIPDSFIGKANFNGLQYTERTNGYKKHLDRNNVCVADKMWKGIRRKDFECYPFHLNFATSIPILEKVLFINTEGDEINQAVSGSAGHVKSKGNVLEVKAVERLYRKLIEKIKPKSTSSKSVLVITQYRLQEHLLKQACSEILNQLNVPGPPLVSTVVKSQGSECDYVIFSTVRSLPHLKDIDKNPSRGWISKYLGFITDRNQFNVAITRAKKGLFIIGNMHLLSVNNEWKNLIDDFKERGCVSDSIFDCIN